MNPSHSEPDDNPKPSITAALIAELLALLSEEERSVYEYCWFGPTAPHTIDEAANELGMDPQTVMALEESANRKIEAARGSLLSGRDPAYQLLLPVQPGVLAAEVAAAISDDGFFERFFEVRMAAGPTVHIDQPEEPFEIFRVVITWGTQQSEMLVHGLQPAIAAADRIAHSFYELRRDGVRFER